MQTRINECHTDEHIEMAFIEFLEAISRICELASKNTLVFNYIILNKLGINCDFNLKTDPLRKL